MSELNDPRVFFAAERTLMAWTRTSLTLLAFGFMVERFGLFLTLFAAQQGLSPGRGPSFWIGLIFMFMGAIAALVPVVQYRRVLATLKPVEIPAGYAVNLGVFINLAIALLGLLLVGCLVSGNQL